MDTDKVSVGLPSRPEPSRLPAFERPRTPAVSSLAILVPSRGRPGNLRRLAEAVEATAQPGTMLYSRLDDDDPTLEEYLQLQLPNVLLSVGPRIFLSASYNELAAAVIDPYVALLGDDVLPETPGWDETLINSLGGRPGVAFGSDGLEDKHGANLCTHVVVPTTVYTALGWIALPACRHLFLDNAWGDIGRMLDNLVYSPNVKLTHLHPWAGLSERDQTYAEANDKDKRKLDRSAYEAWRDGEGQHEARVLLERAGLR